MTDQDGITIRETLEQVERQTGHTPQELIGPDFPELLSYVWSVFLCLHSTRQSGFSGPNPISYQEIQAYKNTTNSCLSSRDVETIKRLDKVYMRVANGKH
jgi:hypothetical protein